MHFPRITRNILSNYVLGGFTSVSTIILTPLMFNRLGSEDYGLLSFALAAVAVIEMLDLGLSSALVRFASRHLELKEWAEIRQISTSIFFLLALLGCILFVAIAGGILLSGYIRTASISSLTKILFLIFSATLPFQLGSAALRAYLIGTHDFYMANLVDGINVLVRATIVIALLLTGYKVIAMVATFAVFAVVRLIGLSVVASRASVPLKLELANVKLSSVTALAKYAVGIFVQDITTGLFFQLDTIIAARVLPWSEVAILTVVRRLPAMLVQFSHRAMAAISPEFAGIWARQDSDTLHRLVIRTTKLLMVVLFCGVTLYVWAEPILSHWIGMQAAAASPAMRAFAVFGVAAALQELPVALFYSIGRVRLSSTVSACTTLAGAVFGTAAALKFGVFGLAVVWAGTQTLATVILTIWAIHCIRLGYGRWLRDGISSGALYCVVIALIWKFAAPLTHGELPRVLTMIALGVLAFGYFVILPMLPSRESALR
jgi:O-antigen/teichoic acid export membrane protein